MPGHRSWRWKTARRKRSPTWRSTRASVCVQWSRLTFPVNPHVTGKKKCFQGNGSCGRPCRISPRWRSRDPARARFRTSSRSSWLVRVSEDLLCCGGPCKFYMRVHRGTFRTQKSRSWQFKVGFRCNYLGFVCGIFGLCWLFRGFYGAFCGVCAKSVLCKYR